jgi:hypothetical protein
MEKHANVRLTVQQRTESPCTSHEDCDSAASPEEFDLEPSEMGRRNTACERRRTMHLSTCAWSLGPGRIHSPFVLGSPVVEMT